MHLKFGTLCRSRGEELGTLWGLAIEPRERLFLRAILERPQADPLVRVKVPFASLARADDEQVVLELSAAELDRMPAHESDDGDDASRRSRRRRRGDEVLEKVLTARTRVHCRDGEAGPLVGLGLDERSGDIEDIALEVGATTPRVIRVKVQDVEQIEDGRIELGLNRDDLAELSDGKL